MPNTAISMNTMGLNPTTGRLQSGYLPVAEGINFVGTIGHGNKLAVTDSSASFTPRTTVKPLFVNFGDSRSGHSLGRITTSHITTNASIDTGVKLGSLASSFKWDIKQYGGSGILATPITTQDQSKPLIQYIERRYEFDYASPRINTNTYYFKERNYNNTITHTIVIDGRTYTHTNDGTAGSVSNHAAVETFIAAAINADSLCKCTAARVGAVNEEVFTLTKKNINDTFDVTYNTEIFQNFNNKSARVYAWDDSGNNDAYLNTYYDYETVSKVGHTNMENDSGNSTGKVYYNHESDNSVFMCEELILKNSTTIDTSTGGYDHYKNSKLLNTGNSLSTWNTGQQKLGRCYLNQFSNGPYGYWQAELLMYFAYQCWDDEYAAIYLADSSTITDSTKKVRQPQTKWLSNQVEFQQVETHVPLSGAYVFERTGLTTFRYLGRLPV